MRATSAQDDEDEELLDDHLTDQEVVHAAAVQASPQAISETHLLHPTDEEIPPDVEARPQWGVSPIERGVDDRVAPAVHAAETDWRNCLSDRNAEFTVCGRVTTRRNMLRAILSPAGVMLLMIVMVVLWLVRGASTDSSVDASGREATVDANDLAQFG